MQSSVGNYAKTSGTKSLVKQEYRRGYNIEAIPYQKGGIMSKVLWPTRDLL